MIKLQRLLACLLILALLLSGCQGVGGIPFLGGKKVDLGIVYGSEKQEWIEPLIQQYNQAQHKTKDGGVIEVTGTAMGSIEAVDAILQGQIHPAVWSPASDIYLPVANAEWRKTHAEDLVSGTPKALVLSPVVIAMWKPMAEALGWPQKPLGWADIAGLATSDKGWTAFNYPEWGSFKFGHTHPGYSNSGLVAVIAEAYAASGKQRGLTIEDLGAAKTQEFMANVESSVIHYGTSTGFFADRMFTRGPSYLSAAVLYENLIVAQESKRLAGTSSQIPVVAIYPKEGTFWSNHPYAVLNAPWVTAEQQAAAQDFQSFLLDKPQQQKAMELGFRPADPAIPLTAPLDAQHGVDIAQPQTVLDVPRPEVIAGVQELWKTVKKPVDAVVVFDTSGSMQGEKITAARDSLIQFIKMLDNRDRVEIIVFSTDVVALTPLSNVGEKRDELLRRVSGIVEGGNTRLYDATLQGYEDLKAHADAKHIRALMVMTDGNDTSSAKTLEQVLSAVGNTAEGGNAIKLFTIAFGQDADQAGLGKMADLSGGKLYVGDPNTIRQIYAEIATFF